MKSKTKWLLIAVAAATFAALVLLTVRPSQWIKNVPEPWLGHYETLPEWASFNEGIAGIDLEIGPSALRIRETGKSEWGTYAVKTLRRTGGESLAIEVFFQTSNSFAEGVYLEFRDDSNILEYETFSRIFGDDASGNERMEESKGPRIMLKRKAGN